MSEPRWDDPALKAGTMVRAALWLVQVIGEGNVFTKQELRDAFPGVAQADRRVRDLREYGWVLDTNVNDVTLSAEEQRFALRGADVWDEEQRRSVGRDAGKLSSKDREAVFAANGYQCVVCGIAGGETYPDRPSETAVLAVSRRTLVGATGLAEERLMTECRRCRAGASRREFSVTEVRDLLGDLDADDLRRLRRWAARGARGMTTLDRAWNGLRALPAAEQSQLLRELE